MFITHLILRQITSFKPDQLILLHARVDLVAGFAAEGQEIPFVDSNDLLMLSSSAERTHKKLANIFNSN